MGEKYKNERYKEVNDSYNDSAELGIYEYINTTYKILNRLLNELDNELNVYNIYSKAEDDLYSLLLNHIIEEMVRNKYKRKQIIDNLDLDIDKNTYKVNEPYEILIEQAKDFDAVSLSELYSSIRKQYFSSINLFDETNPTE